MSISEKIRVEAHRHVEEKASRDDRPRRGNGARREGHDSRRGVDAHIRRRFLDAIGRDAHCSSDGLYDVARIGGKGASVSLHKLKCGARAVSHSDRLIRRARRRARRAGGAVGAIAPAKAIEPAAPLLEEFDDLRKLRETLDAIARLVAAPRMRPAGVARLAIGAERHDLCAPLRSAAPAQRDIKRKADLVKIAHAGCARLEIALAARDGPRQRARDLRLRAAEAFDILRGDVDRDRNRTRAGALRDDAEPAIRAARERHDRLGAALAHQPHRAAAAK